MLNGRSILIVEDQPIIGMALAAAVRKADGCVVGPAASVKAALDLIDMNMVSAAVLDVTLADGTAAPVIEQLIERRIPMIIQSGVGLPHDLAARYPDILVLIKPTTSEVMITHLAKLVAAPATLPKQPVTRSIVPPDRQSEASATGFA